MTNAYAVGVVISVLLLRWGRAEEDEGRGSNQDHFTYPPVNVYIAMDNGPFIDNLLIEI